MDTSSNRNPAEASPPAARLDGPTCWALLRTVGVGRLAVVIDAEPDIFPINHVVDHGGIVFRTAGGTKLTAALGEVPVAFESDGFDADTGEAWSVVVKGRAVEFHDLDDLIDAALLPLAPWHGGSKHRFVRIEPAQITGRRFPVVDPSVWRNPYTLRRSSSFE